MVNERHSEPLGISTGVHHFEKSRLTRLHTYHNLEHLKSVIFSLWLSQRMRPPSRRNFVESSGNVEPPTLPGPVNPSEFQTRAWSLIHEVYLSNRGGGTESLTALVPKFCHLLREVAGSEYSPSLPSDLVRSFRTIREVLSAEGIHSQFESMYQRVCYTTMSPQSLDFAPIHTGPHSLHGRGN